MNGEYGSMALELTNCVDLVSGKSLMFLLSLQYSGYLDSLWY